MKQLFSSKNGWRHCWRAESLIEVIIALFVLALGSGIATTLVITALQSNSFSRDNLVALNMATEGMEALRSIRDNNWLKYSFDRENCWNLRPGQVCEAPFDQKAIATGSYTVHLDKDYVWQITSIDQPLKLAGNLPTNIDYQMKVLKNPQTGLKFYTPRKALDLNSFPPLFNPLPDSADPANDRFFRMVQISNVTALSMQVTSTVQWFSQGAVRAVTLQTQLTNYQKE